MWWFKRAPKNYVNQDDLVNAMKMLINSPYFILEVGDFQLLCIASNRYDKAMPSMVNSMRLLCNCYETQVLTKLSIYDVTFVKLGPQA